MESVSAKIRAQERGAAGAFKAVEGIATNYSSIDPEVRGQRPGVRWQNQAGGKGAAVALVDPRLP